LSRNFFVFGTFYHLSARFMAVALSVPALPLAAMSPGQPLHTNPTRQF
jgi:hypothetical protein